jgi:hypothetical protein
MRITGSEKAGPPATERPAGVSILAVFCLIAGALSVSLSVGALLSSVVGMLINPLMGIFVLLWLAVSVAIAVALFAIGVGLIQMRNWSRVLVIGLASALALLFTIGMLGMAASTVPLDGAALAMEITVIAVAVWVPIYLSKPDVKKAFGKGNREIHDSRLGEFQRCSSKCSDRPETARPSDDGLEFSEFASVVQTCGDCSRVRPGNSAIISSTDLPAARYPTIQDPRGYVFPSGAAFREGSPARSQCSVSIPLVWGDTSAFANKGKLAVPRLGFGQSQSFVES